MVDRVFFTIKSEYADDAFYQIFHVSDLDYKIPFDGKEEWLKGDRKEVEVSIPANKAVKIGFRRQASNAGDWIAPPVNFNPELAVVLTAEGRIIQIHHSLLNFGKLTDANFLDNDKMRAGVSGLGKLGEGLLGLVGDSVGALAMVPVGTIVSVLAELIWPETSVTSLIDAAEIRMRHIIRSELRKMDLSLQQGTLDSIRENLREYANAASPEARRMWQEPTLALFNQAKALFINSRKEYTPGSAWLAITLAGLHVAFLRERVQFEKEIFGNEKVNSAYNRKVLKDTVAEYQKYLADACKKEVAERLKQVSESWSVGLGFPPKGTTGDKVITTELRMRDNVRRIEHLFVAYDGGFNPATESKPSRKMDFQLLVNMYLLEVENEMWVRLREDIQLPAALLSLMIPGKELTFPNIFQQEFTIGPFSSLPGFRHNPTNFTTHKFSDQRVGTITGVQLVTLGNFIMFNFESEHEDGTVSYSIGERLKGRPVRYEKYFTRDFSIKKVETWWDEAQITGARITYSDGTDSGIIGEVKRKTLRVAELKDHILVRFGYMEKWAVRFGFKLRPDFSTWRKN